jgi:hypothetical protein
VAGALTFGHATQMPYASVAVRVWARQSASTGQSSQIRLAAFSRWARTLPRSPSGEKNISVSVPRQEARCCHSELMWWCE